jgi:hypothetical protein
MGIPLPFRLEASDINVLLAILGAWLLIHGAFSSYLKDRLYLSVPCKKNKAAMPNT